MFDSAKLKVERADHHIADLERQLVAFTRENLDASIRYSDRDEGIDITLTVIAPPPSIALTMGDAIHNLWSSLDHMHCEAIWRDCGVKHAQLFFPKGRDRVSFEATCNGTTEASAAIKDVLKSLEVFPGGKGEVLYVANCLDRADKHSVLTPVINAPGIDELDVVWDYGKARRALSELYGSSATLREGETFTIDGAAAGTSLVFKSDAEISPHILFGDVELVQGKQILPTVRQLRHAVANTIKIVESSVTSTKEPQHWTANKSG